MPEIPLNNPDIGSFIDQSITATMPQHVWMNLKMLKAGRLSHLIDQKPDCHTRQRFALLADEERVARLRRIHLRPFSKPSSHSRRLTVVKLVRSTVAPPL